MNVGRCEGGSYETVGRKRMKGRVGDRREVRGNKDGNKKREDERERGEREKRE